MSEDEVWFSESRVYSALKAALNEAVETHGSLAKSVAWDVTSSFRRHLKDAPTPKDQGND